MKACEQNKKSLSLFAIGDLGADEARQLQSHIQTCPGCREYFREISNLTGDLKAAGAATPQFETSAAFHRAWSRRIMSEAQPGILADVFALPWLRGWNWSFVAPAAVAAMALTLVLLLPKHSHQALPGQTRAVAAHTDMAPTFAAYHALANRSLEALDRELTREAAALPAGQPIYAASSIARAITAD